jgi:succinoglycan biosynthesis protein ExoW
MQVAVIIPYFQRQTGILRKALRSVLNQQDAPARLVIVVDDSSPVSAQAETLDTPPTPGVDLRLIRQENRGPAAARNRGLDEVPSDVDYVAFLDSDDEWSPAHLRNAVFALQHGFDFYFANHYQLDQKVGAFERAGRMQMERHRLLEDGSTIYAYQGDMFDQILTGNVIGTSTVVMRKAALGQLRFREQFVYAGEDYLFWMECARTTDRFAFSTDVECTYGAGVNLFSGSGWGTETHLDRVVHETRFRHAVLRLFDLTDRQRQSVERQLGILREGFARDIVHRLRHRRKLKLRLVVDQFRGDPKSAFLLLPNMVRVVVGPRSKDM